MDERQIRLQDWLSGVAGWQEGRLQALGGDASFRRYFRWQHADGRSAMAMDAPPPLEDVRPFLQVRRLLAELGVPVPACHAQLVDEGFLLLEDFGDLTLAQALSQGDDSQADALYRQALTLLADWQAHDGCARAASELPDYDAALLTREMQLLPEWLLAVHLQAPMSVGESRQWQEMMELLLRSALSQPTTLVHRDYHSRNLMVTAAGGLGVLDFQDAVRGSMTYDAVSLLRDAYVCWPEEQVYEWLRFYFLALVSRGLVRQAEWEAFVRAFDWMGVQRHLKVLGIFARLYQRDGKERYLADLPQVLAYVLTVAGRHAPLVPLARWLEQRLAGCL